MTHLSGLHDQVGQALLRLALGLIQGLGVAIHGGPERSVSHQLLDHLGIHTERLYESRNVWRKVCQPMRLVYRLLRLPAG